jgi:flavin reductase ActVB
MNVMSAIEPHLDLDDFLAAMSMWPSGVTITTTIDDDGLRWGFTASAFSSLSLEPPLILVCLGIAAKSHDTFVRTKLFAVNLLSTRHKQLALRFATRGTDKFKGANFRPGHTGSPILTDAVASLECVMHATVPAGDHTILIGKVVHANANATVRHSAPAMVHFARNFGVVSPVEQSSISGVFDEWTW